MPDGDQPYKEDKTEAPSGKKKNKARNEGNVPQSMEITTAWVLFNTILFLYFFGPWMKSKLSEIMIFCFQDINKPDFTMNGFIAYFVFYLNKVMIVLIPILLCIMLTSIITNYLQVGPMFTLTPLRPKFSKIAPNFKSLNMFNAKKMGKTGISFLKLIAVSIVVYSTVKKRMYEFIPLIDESIPSIFVFICKLCFWIVFKVAILLLIIAVLDYIHTYYTWYVEMKMTKQEKEDEAKDAEGDPKVKAEIRKRQMEMAIQRMFSKVPKADVVITNPIHIAVAIEYNPQEIDAPIVIAKGVRLVAERIKEIAKEHRIPIVENRPLARALYKTTDLGSPVPENLYHAVAEVLSYVYKLNNKLKHKIAG